MTLAETVPERSFRAYLAYLVSGDKILVKNTLHALESNAVRRELPESGKRGYRIQCLLLFGPAFKACLKQCLDHVFWIRRT